MLMSSLSFLINRIGVVPFPYNPPTYPPEAQAKNVIEASLTLGPDTKIGERITTTPPNHLVGLCEEVQALLKELSGSSIKRLTLAGLAKKLYLKRLHESDENIVNPVLDERELNRALKDLTVFEAENPKEVCTWPTVPILGGEALKIRI